MAHRLVHLFGAVQRKYQIAEDSDIEDSDLEFRDVDGMSFLPIPPPASISAQDLNAPVLTLRRTPLALNNLPLVDEDFCCTMLKRHWSGRDQQILANLQHIISTVRRHSDFDYYASALPGLYGPCDRMFYFGSHWFTVTSGYEVWLTLVHCDQRL
ncbi:hypothetical protein SK128_021020 [Halocaridina rubra]|uniref:Uncharacterized protein n=1 Tax=Halocaridina rubra TaxID=373956 RepID=A0AAN9A231_HALRR